MQWSDIQFAPSSKTLRQFAALWLGFFAIWGLWRALGHGQVILGGALIALAITIGGLGLARPQAIRWLFVGWMVAAFPIGWVVSRVLLGLLFFGIFLPLGLLFRILGRDALSLRKPAHRQSYWQPKPAAASPQSYFRQF